jgi:hypothetical protein
VFRVAGITEYKYELVSAVMSGDLGTAAMLVKDFCGRISEYSGRMPRGWLDADFAEEVVVTSDGFYIKMDGKYLHCKRHRERWCVSDSATDTPHPCDSHFEFVRLAGAPFPFFEGVRFAIECMEAVSRKSSAFAFADIEKKYKEANQKYEMELGKWSRLHERCEQLKEARERILAELRSVANVSATQRAVSVPVSGLDAMKASLPQPPRETVSVLCATENMVGVSGIYFIWRGGKVVYVGRSQCVASRLKKHHVADAADHVSVVSMPNSETHLAELVYIAAYKPKLNSQVRDSLEAKRSRKRKEAVA